MNAEKTLDLALKIRNDGEFRIDISDPESGCTAMFHGKSPEDLRKPETQEQICSEIYSWLTLMLNEISD